jgi:hypothetical protein
MASLAPEKFGNFDLVKRIKLGFTDVQVSKWRSRVTGLSVVHLDYEGTRTPKLLLAPLIVFVSPHREWLLRCSHGKCGFYHFALIYD